MTLTQWFIFFLIVQLVHFAGTWKLYEAAGRKRWEAAIPVYNSIVLMKIIQRPTWWTILLFVPIVNLIMFPVVWVETLRTFGKRSTADTILGVVTLGFYIYYVNYTQPLNHRAERHLDRQSKTADTVSSIFFAIIVAAIVHTYVMQPFTIPTSSLEKSLLVGDFLFVSKFHYGARVPMTTIASPIVHDTLPLIGKKSYLNWPQLPYMRFPGFQKIKNNDIVVFNWPVDTVYKFFDTSTRKADKPIDKKSNYVKRCVGIPGDSLKIVDGFVYINGKKLILPERAKPQYNHMVYSKKGVDPNLFVQAGSTEYDRTFEVVIDNNNQSAVLQNYITGAEKVGENTFKIKTSQKGIPARVIQDLALNIHEVSDYATNANLTLAGAEEIRKTPGIDSVVRRIFKRGEMRNVLFPQTTDWSLDNYGPIYIPQEGKTVALNAQTIPLYRRIIEVYEHNDVKVTGNEIRINGQPATSYTFKQNYYWMMGDNRHRSEDSRYWGYVPEDHIVGKPVFIWMSIDGINDGISNWHIRTDRLFTTVGGDGQPVSYFKFFLIALALYLAIDFYLKRKKKKKTTE